MREPSPRAPFDEGLFLTHFNKGKELFDLHRYEEAEHQLEEAYLLRPRDPRVLNLLGLVYFKSEKLEKAEEVYRKLAAESPDAHTLYYNLGLIDFKLGRWEESESAFVKAIELGGENPKIHFYLGSIYERLHRFQDAIYQYRQAGANLMVRRVEDKIAGAPARPATAPVPVPAPRPAAAPAGAGPSLALPPRNAPVAPRAPVGAPPFVDDTAEYRASDIQEAIRKKSEEFASRAVRPVGEGVINTPRRGEERRAGDTQPMAPLPPAMNLSDTQPSFPQMVSFPRAEHDLGNTMPPRRLQTFQFLRSNLMEVEFSGKVFIKQGTVYSYGGNLTFWVKEKRPGGHTPLVLVTGAGKLMLTDRDREITFMQVQDETIWVEPSHLLACEEGLTPRYVPLGEPDQGQELLALEGSGMVALSVLSKPLALAVSPDMPVSVPTRSVIVWTGNITPHLVEDQQIFAVMHGSGGDGAAALLRLEGTGRLLVEQVVPS